MIAHRVDVTAPVFRAFKASAVVWVELEAFAPVADPTKMAVANVVVALPFGWHKFAPNRARRDIAGWVRACKFASCAHIAFAAVAVNNVWRARRAARRLFEASVANAAAVILNDPVSVACGLAGVLRASLPKPSVRAVAFARSIQLGGASVVARDLVGELAPLPGEPGGAIHARAVVQCNAVPAASVDVGMLAVVPGRLDAFRARAVVLDVAAPEASCAIRELAVRPR